MINTVEENIIIYKASIAYNIWFARNKKIFEDKDISEDDTISKACQVVQEFKQANLTNYNPDTDNQQAGKHTTSQNSNNKVRWTKPSTGFIKANCNVNLQQEGTWRLGSVQR
jgi:hypothetical protein